MAQPETTLSVDQEAARWSSRMVARIEFLLLFLVLLSLGFAGVDPEERAALAAGLYFYAALVLIARYAEYKSAPTRRMVAAETWAMIPFITWAIWFTDKLASPLRNAYVLAIIVSALVVGMRTTMVQLGLIAACMVLTAEIGSLDALFSVGYLSGLLARLTPLIVVAYVTSMFSSDIRYGMSKARLRSEIDALTGLHNVRGLSIVADRLFARAVRDGQATSALLIDIDHFSVVGAAGDALLKAMAACIGGELRHNDVLARYGDDEFVVLLPETAAPGALQIAERICSAAAATSINFDERRVAATVSVGLVSCDAADGGVGAVLARAERAVRAAKEQGRNRVATLPA